MSDDAHRVAFLALLDAGITQTIHDGKVPTGATLPYVLVYTAIITDSESSLEGQSDVATLRAWCHCVGANATAATRVGDAVKSALLNQRPVVAGRSCGMIRQEESLPPDRDESTGTLVMDAIGVYAFSSWPG